MQKILELIRDPEYRTFLESQDLSALQYDGILLRARIPLEDKLPLMRRLFAAADDPKVIPYLAEHLRQMEEAVDVISNEDKWSCYEVTKFYLQNYTSTRESGRYYHSFAFDDCQTGSELVQTMKMASHCVRKQSFFLKKDKCPCVGIVHPIHIKQYLFYILSGDGTVWGCTDTMDVWNNHLSKSPPDYEKLELPHPYQVGDIVTVDMQPFFPLQHFLILGCKDHGLKTEGLLLDEEGFLSRRSLARLNEDCDLLTPYLTLSRCTEKLTGKEAFLSEMADSIRKAPELAALYLSARLPSEKDPAAKAREIAEAYFRKHPQQEKE